jgi:IS30 family transposase
MVGKKVHSRSGKNLPLGRQRRIFDREKVRALRAEGLSYRQIASRLDLEEGTVRRVLQPSNAATAPRQNLTADIP